ncbi:MAG: SpoIID/LytB domain-containing protein [Clostridia bacterium]
MDSARLRSMAIVAVVLLLALGGLFLARGRSGPQEGDRQAGRDEPTVTLVFENGRRESMPMEQYVKGVVAGEMGRLPPRGETEERDWPEQAYAAQAILARSFAVRYLEETGGNEIPAEHEAAQAYNPDNITQAIERGVERTRGEVMTYQGETVRAWFHSYSGGRTATAREGLGQEEDPPYIKSVETGENEYVPEDVARWQVTMSLEEVGAALRERDIDVGRVRDIRIAERGPSQRVTVFEIEGTEGTRTVSGNDFRLAVGPERLKSTLIDNFEVGNGMLAASGRGFGHGVGLSQWDAYKFAREGRSPEEIVEFFFDGIEIRRLWD